MSRRGLVKKRRAWRASGRRRAASGEGRWYARADDGTPASTASRSPLAACRNPPVSPVSIPQRHVIQVRRMAGEVRRRAEAGEGAEVVIEVRLVEVAAAEGHAGQIDLGAPMDSGE